jgi:rhodanese-related sulfurtransferase
MADMQPPKDVLSKADFKARLFGRCAIILLLSSVLGLAFNSSNPIGIRWANSAKNAEATLAAAAPAPQPNAPAVATRELSPALQSYTNLSLIEWTNAKPLVAAGEFLVVDVRGAQTFEAGHIPGAVFLYEYSSPELFSEFQKKYDTNTPLLVYCASITCHASEEIAKKLVEQYGYKKALVLKGGYFEWQKFEMGFDPMPTRISWPETKALLAAGKIVLVDARSKAAYDAGHIPGAVSLYENAAPEDYKAFQKQYGPKTHIVAYCTDLKCSMSMRTAIKLVTWYNFQKVQFMPGGYQEWQQSELGNSGKQ